MTRARRLRVELPRGHYLPVAGHRRRDCALSLACQMAHVAEHGVSVPSSCPPACGWSQPLERLDVADYVYRPGSGAGALAHADQYRERWADDPKERRGGR